MRDTALRRMGIDIGGTFTDFVIVDETGQPHLEKVPSTPDEPARAVREGLAMLAEREGISVRELLAGMELIVHGTTIATNTLIQRAGAKTGILHTRGFRDILYLRDGFKPDRYNLHMAPPEPLVPRFLRLGVDERVVCDGSVRTPLDEDSVREALRTFAQEGVESVAVVLLWSVVNPDHEQRIRELVEEELPGVYVAVSSDVLPVIREYPRTCATVLSAYVGPALGRYVDSVVEHLREHGYERDLLIMQVSGGVGSVDDVQRRPVFAIGSGPAAGPAAGIALAAAEGERNLLVTDMGGTSFEVTLVTDGQPSMTRDAEVDGIPLGLPAADINSIGAGGGSIAWIDSGSMLRVGPRSAGARPGPACYGHGGVEPTVTDANLILGYLNPDYFLGGGMALDLAAAERAMRRIAEPLEMTVEEAAAAVYRIVNANMVGAMRAVSIMRGIHPREYTLVVGGGAAGAHAGKMAEELGSEKVLFPVVAGGVCAYGMVVADLVHWDVATYAARSDKLELARVNELLGGLERAAIARFAEQGIPAEDVSIARFVDAKYAYQVHELMVPVPGGELGAADIEAIAGTFHDQHRRLYSYAMAELPLDLVAWRIRATASQGSGSSGRVTVVSGDEAVRKGTRAVLFAPEDGRIQAPIYDGESVPGGASIVGPAVIELPTTSLVVWPGQVLARRSSGEFVLDVGAQQHAHGADAQQSYA